MTQALLLDLDGTLIDTAIDLIESLQILRERHGRSRINYAHARPSVPNGSAAIVQAGFSDVDDPEKLEALRLELLDIYGQQLFENPNVFEGLEEAIHGWEQTGKPWGVVTNKPRAYTEPLFAHTGIDKRLATLVCGDDLEQRKPHPMPLIHAAQTLGLKPEDCVYLGDDLRDVTACRAANMPVLVAAYDYLPDNSDPYQWNADGVVEHPSQLLDKIEQLSKAIA